MIIPTNPWVRGLAVLYTSNLVLGLFKCCVGLREGVRGLLYLRTDWLVDEMG